MSTVYSNPLASSLALILVKEQYGELCEMVCRCLLRRGRQTLSELLKWVTCSRQELKEALLLLIQQNCVNCYLRTTESTVRAAASSAHVYELATGSICQNLRKPRFLMHVRDEGGELAELVIESLLEHGRMRLQQIVAQVSHKMETETGDARSDVVNALTSLVNSRYIERAPPVTLPVPEKEAFSSKVLSRAAKEEAARERSIRQAPHAAYQKERFRLPPDLYDAPMDAEKIGTDAGGEALVGEKRKAPDPGGEAQDSVSTVLWRVNPDEFNRRFRHTACVALVSEKLGLNSGIVVEAMLSVSRTSENAPNEPETRAVNIGEIRRALDRKGDDNPACRDIDVVAVLNDLSQDPLEIVVYQGDTAYGSTYCVNMERIIDVLRLKETEAIVKQRFGVPALRAFRLLFQRHQLEQKQIADMIMCPMKDTRKVLYGMLKAGYISMQEVPKTQDHAPSRTFYLFRIDYGQTKACVAAELYKAAANLRLRFASEQDREKEVLARLEMNQALNAVEHKRLIRMKNVANVLDASLLRLDELIAVFNDF